MSSSLIGGIATGKAAASATKCCPNGSCEPICKPVFANCPPPCCEAIFAGGTTTYVVGGAIAGVIGVCCIGFCLYAHLSNTYISTKDMQKVPTTDPEESPQTNHKMTQPQSGAFALDNIDEHHSNTNSIK